MIEFQDVTVCYEPDKRHPVRSLDGISLKIERGDWVFLVGPSGAGKSSLLKLIYAGMKAQSGRVIVDGADISSISARDVPALRRKIGIVFQDFQLLSEKTAWENVAFALRVIGTPQSVIVREVPRALETVGLTHRADALPHELSGGEQQRIAIARALVNNPPILLTDEPTGNLDPQTAREVGQLLTKINFERGTTIVMATHDGAFVNEMARRVVRLKAGTIVSDENPGTYGSDSEEIAPALPVIQLPVAAPVVVAPIIVAAPVVAPPVVIETQVEPQVVPAPVVVPEIATPEMAVPVRPVEIPDAMATLTTIPEPVSAISIAPVPKELTEEVPIEVPVPAAVEENKPEVAEPVMALKPAAIAPQIEEVVVEKRVTPDSKPAIPSGNWAQIAATAPKQVSNKTQLGHLDPYSVDGVQPKLSPHAPEEEEGIGPRPMARRIAEPVPPLSNGHALDPHTPVADPSAPLGSPENPIVQYE